ncbi:MAG TPA: pyridoxal-phosphate dependent enzyme [Gaiellaceae bacterium]|nr:pyridoxal-phosphate dependent enzyme [Gaiellaceae bacterium]
MSPAASTVACTGCGHPADPRDPYPFRCPKAGTDDVDHVMARVLDSTRVRFPRDRDPNPFIRYRELLHSYHLATEAGMSDEDYRALVAELDRAVAAVDGHGFRATPFSRSVGLADAIGLSAAGGIWAKDETGNVSGSHKGRHLMGLALHLEVVERIGLTDGSRPPLAIASCGNAALAAAVVAAAAGRELHVFVPVDADPTVVGRLDELGAHLVVCPRESSVPGDPTYLRLEEALAEGAIPFTCQGNLNGLAIEGGQTIAYEIAAGLATADERLDHLVVQVGGGALASACIQGLREAETLGALERMPRIHTVQTASAHPLERAYHLLRAGLSADPSATELAVAMREAAASRSAYMWPWEEEPKSVATGILDDETYDWRAVVAGMLATGGHPAVVDEQALVQANDLAVERTGIPVDPTGSSGLAGVLALRREGVIGDDDRVAVLFTGVRRTSGRDESPVALEGGNHR